MLSGVVNNKQSFATIVKRAYELLCICFNTSGVVWWLAAKFCRQRNTYVFHVIKQPCMFQINTTHVRKLIPDISAPPVFNNLYKKVIF